MTVSYLNPSFPFSIFARRPVLSPARLPVIKSLIFMIFSSSVPARFIHSSKSCGISQCDISLITAPISSNIFFISFNVLIRTWEGSRIFSISLWNWLFRGLLMRHHPQGLCSAERRVSFQAKLFLGQENDGMQICMKRYQTHHQEKATIQYQKGENQYYWVLNFSAFPWHKAACCVWYHNP